jgi:hypothetical protein
VNKTKAWELKTGGERNRVRVLFKLKKPGPLGLVGVNWLCRGPMPWNDGILECWNNGYLRIISFFDAFGNSEIKIKTFSYFYTQYSIFPSFHHSIAGQG